MNRITTTIKSFLTAPLRVIDDWTESELVFGLTETDLIADLDPGWLEWRESLGQTESTVPVAA